METINKEFEQCHLEMDLRKSQSGDYVSSSTIDCYRSFLAWRVSGISYCSVRDKARVDTKDAFPAYTHPPAHKAITAEDVTDEMLDAYFALDGLDDWRELAASLIGAAKKQCAEIVNAFNGVKP